MLENSYKIENVLMEIIHTVANDDMAKNIIELLTVLNEFGYTDVDELILHELLGTEIETSDMSLFIKNKLLKVSSGVLRELGIGLNEDIRLVTIINIMLTLYNINNLENSLKGPLLTILEDVEKDNSEKVALMVSLHSNGQHVEVFESIDFVTDIFISTYVHKLQSEYELDEDADTDTFEEDFKLMTNIIEIDPIMTSTLVVRSMMANLEINLHMGDHLKSIVQCVDDVDCDTKSIAANIATLLYVCDDTKDDMIGGYTVYIEDNIFTDMDLDTTNTISALVKEYIHKLSLIPKE